MNPICVQKTLIMCKLGHLADDVTSACTLPCGPQFPHWQNGEICYDQCFPIVELLTF